ncbi:MAG: hypothetical protein MZW92_19990 [Comamonadaceae bacterium]|nr:hypothetical protein [Comamonadaceae bacterium]
MPGTVASRACSSPRQPSDLLQVLGRRARTAAARRAAALDDRDRARRRRARRGSRRARCADQRHDLLLLARALVRGAMRTTTVPWFTCPALPEADQRRTR